MSQDDRIRWDRQHGETHGRDQPAPFLRQVFDNQYADITAGRALDIACGTGRNALFLAEKGFKVTAIDISSVALGRAEQRALEKSLAILWRQADLENYTLEMAFYDLVVNFDYLQRPLLTAMKAALKIGGFIIFDTYLVDQQAIGHPKNPDYLLRHNELLDSFRDFRVLYYREGSIISNSERSFRAGIFAQKVR
jgi:2-polyprenyl-3-methyl-5-hydroxy-6-metoxy-1,4-benzoquinol methylase